MGASGRLGGRCRSYKACEFARAVNATALDEGDLMYIVVYGLGYVGLTAAACLAKGGHKVLGVDLSDEKVAAVNRGVSPIAEPGIEAAFSEARQSNLLRATHDPSAELAEADMAMVCVGTPSSADGTHDLSYIAEVTRQIASAVKPDRPRPLTVVYRSTIRPGTIDDLVLPIFRGILGDTVDAAVEVVYNPEFLRESTAMKDYFNPPKIVVGTGDGKPSSTMEALYEGIDAPRFNTRFREAEITKFVDNSWHAVKVGFANEIGRLCVRLGIDAGIVSRIFLSDTKLNVSAYYLRPGGAFGGSCLPKDVRALQHLAGEAGINAAIVDSVLRSNDAHKHFAFDLCTRDLTPGARVLVVGLAFKSDSDDLRESPNLDLVSRLVRAGYEVSVYDPSIVPERLMGQNLGYAYANLPSLRELLVDREQAERDSYDLLVDANGQGGALNVRARQIVNLHSL
jgi:nucleotide sugar dehydrogenase